jgi:hypothetical protein
VGASWLGHGGYPEPVSRFTEVRVKVLEDGLVVESIDNQNEKKGKTLSSRGTCITIVFAKDDS